MQSITPLTSADFKNKSNIVIGKVEIDSDGVGTYIALPDIIDFNINTNIENQVGRLCSYSFSITVLNTDDQFNPYNDISPYYDYLKQGRRIKLYAGIKVSGTEYYYQWLIGRVDDYKLNEQAGQNICTITGRDFMRIITEYRLYSPDTYWGTTELLNTVSGQVRYDLNVNCKGVYIAYLDSTSPYDGSNYEEIYENQDWTYDWHNNQFCFTKQRIPDFAGTNNLKVYCMTTQTVEDAVGHILYLAGIFATNTARDTWIANASYVTPTSKTIDRIWYNTGISALEAIRLLAEVVQYRLYFDYAGNPIFKPKASIGTIVDTLNESDITVENIEENEEETYTHIIIEGEERDRILGDDEMAPAVPSGLELTTGFGESTQAGLAYIKATWDSNTEIDFGHYELRIKKNADSDYTEVSTIATSYMFLGLEPGVTYNIQIRACDIYENRSDWSTAENIVTATDSGTPVKIAGETATAILAGIKVEWTEGIEYNISYYKVERQESPDNVDWTGGWVEKAQIDGNMWLDLLLTYSKYYRYRITAYTVAGVVGVTSDFTTAVQPNQAATADIDAAAITATEVATNAVTEIKIAANAVTSNKIITNAIIADKIYSGAVGTDKLAALAITTDKIAAGAITTVKIDALAVTTDSLAANAITADKIAANSIYTNALQAGVVTTAKLEAGSIVLATIANDFDWGTLGDDGHKPDNDADVTGDNTAADITNLPATPTGSGLFANGTYLGYYDSGTWKAFIRNNGYFKFYGSATNYIEWNGSALSIQGNIQLGSTNSIYTAGKTSYADTTAGFWLGYSSGYKLNIGTGSATPKSGNCLLWDGSGLTVRGSLKVGGGTNEDITFEDSGIRLYDVGSYTLRFFHTAYAPLDIVLASTFAKLQSTGALAFFSGGSPVAITLTDTHKSFYFYDTGTLQLPVLGSSAPTAHAGDLALECSSSADGGNRMHYYSPYVGWQYFDDSDGW